MHACIERALKNKVLYTPDQVYSIIMNAKVSGEKYILKEMQQSEILNIKELVEPKRWLQDKTGERVRWSDVMEISVSYNKPVFFSNTILIGIILNWITMQAQVDSVGRNRCPKQLKALN
ncbi:hypothetical protein HF086_002868 [Spodoptera exigua]|uniref:Uncharacterized protein n=1 Tax=Spodoptera exigua TaxID=7107 RepID=A0A922M954_SPOEX|nr:hypothetical protein HF086_002868 [Spodoptera exigua]